MTATPHILAGGSDRQGIAPALARLARGLRQPLSFGLYRTLGFPRSPHTWIPTQSMASNRVGRPLPRRLWGF